MKQFDFVDMVQEAQNAVKKSMENVAWYVRAVESAEKAGMPATAARLTRKLTIEKRTLAQHEVVLAELRAVTKK